MLQEHSQGWPQVRTALGRVLLLVLALGLLGATPKKKADKPDESTVRVVEAAVGSPAAVVQKALLLAQEPDEAKAFQGYLELMHEDWRHNQRAIEQLRAFSWQRFRRQVGDYVLADTKVGFLLSRQDPEKVEPETEHVRLFLDPTNNPKRLNPTPIRLQRVGGAWLITANSL